MKKYIIILAIALIFFTGCSLKRSNPLDPNSHDINIPSEITNLVVTHSAAHTDNHWAQLTWDKLPTENADGYYIYRGQSYNGTYQRVQDLINPPNPSDSLAHPIVWVDSDIVPGDYYYKVSAHKRQGANSSLILEGHISSWVYTRVPQ